MAKGKKRKEGQGAAASTAESPSGAAPAADSHPVVVQTASGAESGVANASAPATSDGATGGKPSADASGKPADSGAVLTALKLWFSAYRVEVILFAVSFVVLTGFSGQRFLRQSAAPHFIYQAKAWLEGRLDLDPQVLPNLEDWACVREVNGEKVRCEGRPLVTDKWYVSFPPFPAVAMLPFVAVNGYQFNDTSFGVLIGALAVAFFYALLRYLQKMNETVLEQRENTALSVLLAFGTLFFYCAIRGEVWFSAEVMGVLLTCLYARNAVKAHRPLLAGLFFSMATLTRTPLLFTGLFFVLEAVLPGPDRRASWKEFRANPRPALGKLGWFAVGAAPLAIASAAFNLVRFGKLSEFGHKFLFNNRVNADIDTWGLFNVHYLARNLKAAFFILPDVKTNPLTFGWDPHGLSLFLTLPLLVFIFVPRHKAKWNLSVPARLAILAAPFVLKAIGIDSAGYSILFALIALAYVSQTAEAPRLSWAIWLTVAVTALPGLLYQNDGYAQWGFRFSLDYTPYLLLLFGLSGWRLFKDRAVLAVALFAIVVNFWGAVAFRGYTEYVRNW